MNERRESQSVSLLHTCQPTWSNLKQLLVRFDLLAPLAPTLLLSSPSFTRSFLIDLSSNNHFPVTFGDVETLDVSAPASTTASPQRNYMSEFCASGQRSACMSPYK